MKAYRILCEFDRTARPFLGRRWRIRDCYAQEFLQMLPGIHRTQRGFYMWSTRRYPLGARCNPLEILKEWQRERRMAS